MDDVNHGEHCVCFPVPADYSNVAILKPGVFNAGNGVTVALGEAELLRIADNFDPAHLLPTLNIDHEDSGPALGRVTGLRFDGEFLRADIRIADTQLAERIERGDFPSRSAEIYTDLDGQGPALRAVALLGAMPPAVKGLPPMLRDQHPPLPAAEAMQPNALAAAPQHQPFCVTLLSEVPMGNELQPEPAREAALLAEENQRLAEENRRLLRHERQREIAVFLSELRNAGRLTPALEQAGIEQLLLAACETPLVVRLSEDNEEPLFETLHRVFSALPVCVSFGETDFRAAPPAPCGLSEDERTIAAQLGLSAEEYAEIRRTELR